MATKVNLGCGPVFVDSDEWLNLDFSPPSSVVRQANLLERLPIENESATLVYSSHFLEHVPRTWVPGLLDECFRVLQPGGVLRLAVPDLENMVREYLTMREGGMHDKADFVVLELIDQCVRREPGGQLGQFYHQIAAQPPANVAPMIDYIRARTGEDLGACTNRLTGGRKLRPIYAGLRRRIQRAWISLCLLALPAAFRVQNVSLAAVGERHHWLWDFHQLQAVLAEAGFTDIVRCTADTSGFAAFPFQPLDLDAAGRPRKGAESMYIEARKAAQ